MVLILLHLCQVKRQIHFFIIFIFSYEKERRLCSVLKWALIHKYYNDNQLKYST